MIIVLQGMSQIGKGCGGPKHGARGGNRNGNGRGFVGLFNAS